MRSLIFIISSLLLIASIEAHTKSINNDFLLLNQNHKGQELTQSKKNRSWNPLAIGYQAGIKVYQKVISEQLATSCAFELTCSRFSSAMVKEHGFVKGYFLTFDRLVRCSQIVSLETLPIRLNRQNKVIETPADFHFHN